MIDPFEQRLADLLADRVEPGAFTSIGRAASDTAPVFGELAASVRVEQAEASALMNDDAREVLSDRASLRRVIKLSGTALVRVQAALGADDSSRTTQRRLLVIGIDSVLSALHASEVRAGTAFDTGADQGFAIEAFRLIDFRPAVAATADSSAVEIRYAFEGRFWPIEPVITGDAIQHLPLRMAVLAREVDPIRVRAGAADITIAVPLALQVSDGAQPTLTARLLGASPPGALVGDSTGLPPGLVAFPRAADGSFNVVYRPPPTVVGSAEARIALQLAAAGRPTIPLGNLTVVIGS